MILKGVPVVDLFFPGYKDFIGMNNLCYFLLFFIKNFKASQTPKFYL